MGNIRKGRSERESITVTNDYVEHQIEFLTDRDKAMLRLLYKYPFLSSRHLYWMTPKTTLKAFWEIKNGQQRCNDRIRLLFNKHFIYKFSPRKPPGKGTSVQYCLLDKAALKYFGSSKRPTYYNDTMLPRHFRHTIATIDAISNCYKAHANGSIKLLYADYEPLLKNTDLKPDAIIMYEKEGEYHFQWIEVDRDEKSIKKERQKIKTLEEYYLKQKWREEEWNRAFNKPVFPKITYLIQPRGNTNRRMVDISKILSQSPFSHETHLYEKWSP